MKAYLGDWVKETKTGAIGRVYDKHHTHGDAGVTREWLAHQDTPFTASDLVGVWYSVLCEDGGSIITAEPRIELVAPKQTLNNNYESFYFSKPV